MAHKDEVTLLEGLLEGRSHEWTKGQKREEGNCPLLRHTGLTDSLCHSCHINSPLPLGSCLPTNSRPGPELGSKNVVHIKWMMMTQQERTRCSTLKTRGRWLTSHWRHHVAYDARIEREPKRRGNLPPHTAQSLDMDHWPLVSEMHQDQGQRVPFKHA